MAAEATITLTNEFMDGTKRNLQMGSLAVSAINLENIRTKIKNLNSDTSVINSLYLSDSGANFKKVSAAKISVTNEMEINLND